MGAHCNFYSRIKTLAFLQLIKNISRMTLHDTGRQQNTKDAINILQIWAKTENLESGDCWSVCQHGRLNNVVGGRDQKAAFYALLMAAETSDFCWNKSLCWNKVGCSDNFPFKRRRRGNKIILKNYILQFIIKKRSRPPPVSLPIHVEFGQINIGNMDKYKG